MKRSLRTRLLVPLAGTILAAWVATAVFTYLDARGEIDEMLDAQLAQSAGLLVAQVGPDAHALQAVVVAPAHRHERALAFQVWEDQVVRIRSEGAPAQRLSASAEGFSDSIVAGERWRVFGRRSADGAWLVQVGEPYALRQALAGSVASHLLQPLALALPALAALIWLAVGWGVAPLAKMARELAARAPDDMSPLRADDAPDEVMPLVRSLDALFSRVASSIEKERRFTADAAHELRTPLAALKTQAQVALGARDAPERDRALRQVIAGVDRAARLVDQLLTMAKLEQAGIEPELRPVRLDEAAAACLAELAPFAAARDVDAGLDGEDVKVAADPVLLAVLLRNLVENALRYTPAGGAVSVETCRGEHGPVLVVEDDGPGIPEQDRERATERFYRMLGSGEQGSGLGLSIAARIAVLHDAELALLSGADGRGLRVEVRFPTLSGL